MKKILLILVSILSILTLTACGKTDEELDKEFDDKVYNTLINYSAKVYDNNQYQKYQILDNQYYISLKNLKELGYDISMFNRPSTKKQCDLEQTGITITLVSDTYNTSYSVLCE